MVSEAVNLSSFGNPQSTAPMIRAVGGVLRLRVNVTKGNGTVNLKDVAQKVFNERQSTW